MLLLLGLLALALLLREAFGGRGGAAAAEFTETTFIENAGIYDKFVTAGGFFALDTTGGLSFYEADGTRVFRHGHGILGGALFGSGEYAAVVARGGNVINLYNTTGLVHTTTINGQIRRFALDSGGYAAAAIYANGGHNIMLYDRAGQAHELLREEDARVLPMAMALSGNRLAIAHADISGPRLNSTITFININSRAGQYSGEIAAKNLHNPEQIIGSLHFMGGRTLLAVADTRIFAVNYATGDNLWEIPLNNIVRAAVFNTDNFAIAYGSALLNRDGLPAGTVNVYSTNGAEIFSAIKENPTNLSLGFGNIIIQATTTCTIYEIGNGTMVWEGRLAGAAEFMGGRDRLAVSAPGGVKILQRR
ncbi:MAG: DUF5711 family protein [Clostridiales bacterium]|jgi:hypothetical protein|nr:DUF5711 family protein [Clostridiales bacterium]